MPDGKRLSGDDMELHEIGQKLKEARKNKGLSLHDVHDNLKLSVLVLEAMEEGKEKDLPHPVYAKGFLQEYARFLGLDWNELGAAFDRLYEAEEEYGEEGELPTSLKISSKPKPPSPAPKLIIGGILILVLVGFAWLVFSPFISPEAEKTAEPASAKGSAPESSSRKENGKGAAVNRTDTRKDKNATMARKERGNEGERGGHSLNDTAQANGSLVGGNATAGEIAEEAESSRKKVAAENGSAGGDSSVQGDLSGEKKDRVMKVSASADCWLRTELDGVSREFYLRPGDSVSLRFDDTLYLRLGNSGGVDLTLDGEDYRFEGGKNEVRTIEIGMENND